MFLLYPHVLVREKHQACAASPQETYYVIGITFKINYSLHSDKESVNFVRFTNLRTLVVADRMQSKIIGLSLFFNLSVFLTDEAELLC